MTTRDLILARVDQALSKPSPSRTPAGARNSIVRTHPVEDTSAAQWTQFALLCAGLKTDLHFCDNESDLHRILKELSVSENWTRVATHGAGLTLTAAKSTGLPVHQVELEGGGHALENCEASLTECDALIAQTGSVLLTSASAGGRTLSVLPPHHMVLARRDQLVPDLPAAFALLQQKYGHAWPSLSTIITGPSRTGDIERILVLGAHGPKRMTIFVI